MQSFKNLGNESIDNIISYLPISTQSKISKKYYNKVAPIAINKIKKMIKNNKIRLQTIMDYELPCTLKVLQAQYILYYPDDLRFSYVQLAINKLINLNVNIDFLTLNEIQHILNNENNTNYNNKQLFKKLIQIMTVEEILKCGW